MQSKLICFTKYENNREVNNLFIRYKVEVMPQGYFCLKNKVLYNLFHKCHKDTRYRIVPGQQLGQEPEKALSVSIPTMGTALSSPSSERLLYI